MTEVLTTGLVPRQFYSLTPAGQPRRGTKKPHKMTTQALCSRKSDRQQTTAGEGEIRGQDALERGEKKKNQDESWPADAGVTSCSREQNTAQEADGGNLKDHSLNFKGLFQG